MRMTKEEAQEIISRYRAWNFGQQSTSLAFNGVRSVDDDIYDERRKLILCAYRSLNDHYSNEQKAAQ